MNLELSFSKRLFGRYLISTLIISSALINSLHADEAEIPKMLSEQTLNRLSPNSFNRYYRNVYSQCGEDGIVEEIFKRLNIKSGFFVEFGGADGIWFSNTRYLWEKGWSGVMIEADDAKFAQLAKCYEGMSTMLTLHDFVTWKEDDARGHTLDKIAEASFPDKEIDFLSIDVDGADYLILEGLKMRPKVICVEAGMHWHPLFNERIPDEYAIQNAQQPLFPFSCKSPMRRDMSHYALPGTFF